MVNSCFAYGTLQRGECRERLWPAVPLGIQAGFVKGRLFGRDDYPALIQGDDLVSGELWSFNPTDLPRVLKTLDEIEGTHGNAKGDLYHRHIVNVFDRTGQLIENAFVYFYNRDPEADGFDLVSPKNGVSSWNTASDSLN